MIVNNAKGGEVDNSIVEATKANKRVPRPQNWNTKTNLLLHIELVGETYQIETRDATMAKLLSNKWIK